MALQLLFKLSLLLAAVSVVDCGDVNLLEDSLKFDGLVNVLNNLFQKLTNIIINKDTCKAGLENVNHWFKSTICHGRAGDLSSISQQLMKLLSDSHNSLNFSNNRLNFSNNSTKNPDKSTEKPKSDLRPKSNPSCNNDYHWKLPALLVAGSSQPYHDYHAIDVIDGKCILRPEINDLSFQTPSALVLNSAGNRIYMCDANILYVYLKDPCHDGFFKIHREKIDLSGLTLDPSQKFLAVSKYGGEIAVYSHLEDEAFVQVSAIQPTKKGPKVFYTFTTIKFHPKLKNLLILIEGNTDTVVIYKFNDTTGSMTDTDFRAQLPVGSSPFDSVLSDDGRFMYGSRSRKIFIFEIVKDATGMITGFNVMKEVEVLKSEDDFSGSSYLSLHPNGEYLYYLNYYYKSIAIFRINSGDGSLSSLGFESPPAGGELLHFAMTADGKVLAASSTNKELIPFSIKADGTLTPMTPTAIDLVATLLVPLQPTL